MPSFVLNGTADYLLLVGGALFAHICYQLSVSVLAYMSAHSLSRRVGTQRLLALGASYAAGALAATVLVLTTIVVLTNTSVVSHSEAVRWLTLVTAVVAPMIGLLTIIVYYRRGEGTRLWLPRTFARYLLERAQKTRSGVEAFSLGLTTVLSELPFIAGPLLLVAVAIAQQPADTWLAYALLYAIAAALPLVLLTFYLTSGHSIARMQQWRENNKLFLQWMSGLMLVALTLYIALLQFGGGI